MVNMKQNVQAQCDQLKDVSINQRLHQSDLIFMLLARAQMQTLSVYD